MYRSNLYKTVRSLHPGLLDHHFVILLHMIVEVQKGNGMRAELRLPLGQQRTRISKQNPSTPAQRSSPHPSAKPSPPSPPPTTPSAPPPLAE